MIVTSPTSPSSATLSHASEVAPLVATSPYTHPQVFVKKPWQRYGLALLPTTIVLLSFSFYGILSQTGTVSAPQPMAEMVASNPRISAQVVAVLGSFLTLSIKWGLGRVFTLVAQQRLAMFRTIYEIEFWSSLKNGGVLWSMRQGRMRWGGTAVMVTIALLCGLLTSGFVSLLSPLPIKISEQIVGDSELDYSAPACGMWIHESTVIQDGWGGDCRRWWHHKNYSFQRCETSTQMYEVLDAGRASMLAYVLSTTPFANPQTHISVLNRMGGARILGSTGGVIPMGPSGINSFSVRASSPGSEDVRRFQPRSNYTVLLQGIWVDVSCWYIDLARFTWDQQILNSTCSEKPEKILDLPTADGEILLGYCGYETYETWIYYLRSGNEGKAEGSPFAGVGRMACEVVPRLHTIGTTYDASLGAFVMKPLKELPKPPAAVYWHANFYTQKIMIQRGDYGNFAGLLIDLIAVSRLGLPGMTRHEGYPPLVASMIKGIFEYQASHLRLVLGTVFSNTTPPGCFKPVVGSVNYPGIGWEARGPTLLSLLPLAILGGLIVSLATWAGLMQRGMRLFDPTSPISLIAGASAGGVHFDSKVVGDPDDEEVRKTRVKYALLPDASGPQWGLVDDANFRMKA